MGGVSRGFPSRGPEIPKKTVGPFGTGGSHGPILSDPLRSSQTHAIQNPRPRAQGSSVPAHAATTEFAEDFSSLAPCPSRRLARPFKGRAGPASTATPPSAGFSRRFISVNPRSRSGFLKKIRFILLDRFFPSDYLFSKRLFVCLF